MATKLRKSPPVCLLLSILRLLSGQLQLPKLYIGNRVRMNDSQKFTIFRHITQPKINRTEEAIVFIVRFKFARLSHKANKIASIIPMLLITGFPGFNTKMYAVNHKNGYWQGMYQWRSKQHLEDYKKSFVYRTMNKRAIIESITEYEFKNELLLEFIEKHSYTT